jgi:hypothetical protein
MSQERAEKVAGISASMRKTPEAAQAAEWLHR